MGTQKKKYTFFYNNISYYRLCFFFLTLASKQTYFDHCKPFQNMKNVEPLGILSNRLPSSFYRSPAGNCMFKVHNRNTRSGCEICSKLTINHWRRSGIFIVNFEYISHLVLVFLLLTLSR